MSIDYERLTLPYWMTRDYDRLRQLLGDRNEIVCFVDYNFHGLDGPPSRDVCSARCFADDDNIRISARGIQYNDPLTHVNDSVKFIADCKRMNLEFIDPEPKSCPNQRCKYSETFQGKGDYICRYHALRRANRSAG